MLLRKFHDIESKAFSKSINKNKPEISQFADDTSVILDGSEESLNETLLELEWFKKISGLKINFSKTQVIWIGSKKYSSDRLCENWMILLLHDILFHSINR
jgi:hypothetical protein